MQWGTSPYNAWRREPSMQFDRPVLQSMGSIPVSQVLQDGVVCALPEPEELLSIMGAVEAVLAADSPQAIAVIADETAWEQAEQLALQRTCKGPAAFLQTSMQTENSELRASALWPVQKHGTGGLLHLEGKSLDSVQGWF